MDVDFLVDQKAGFYNKGVPIYRIESTQKYIYNKEKNKNVN